MIKALNVLPTEVNPALLEAGPRRAWGQARESLDVALAAGTTIKARLVNQTDPVTLTLITTDGSRDNDAAHRVVLPSDGSWQEVTALSDAGVFANVQGLDTWAPAPQVEYCIVSGQSWPMPQYRYGQDAAAFIDQWKTGGSPFAVIADPAITFAIHTDDLTKIESIANGGVPITLPNFTRFDSEFISLDDLIQTYRDLISTYDSWLGLDNSAPQHLRTQMSYFVRPDVNSPGFAYFRSSFQDWEGWKPGHMGGTVGTSSIDAYLNGLTHARTLAMLHEAAHGYDGQMTQDWFGFDLGEVWNNIYVHYYQHDVIKLSRTYLYWDDRAERQAHYDALRAAARPDDVWASLGDDWEDAAQLDAIIRMIDLTGMAGFIRFNKEIRDRIAAGEDAYWDARADLILRHLGESSGYNFIPWLAEFSIHPIDVEDRTWASATSIAMPLNSIITDPAQQAAEVARLGLLSAYSLVTPEMLRPSGLTTSFRIATTNPGPVTLLDRGVVVATANVVAGHAQFTDIPVGYYRLDGAGPGWDWVGADTNPDSTRVLKPR